MSAQIIHLGQYSLLKIPKELIQVSESENVETPAVVLILDVSGSMSEILTRLMPSLIALFEEKIREDGITENEIFLDLITFSNIAVHTRQSLNGLKSSRIHGSGGTQMNGVLPLLEKILVERKNAQILVISDGEVWDVDTFVENCLQMTERIRSELGCVQVVGVRLQTSGHNAPDTRAIACFRNLHTEIDNSALLDVKSRKIDIVSAFETIGGILRNYTGGRGSCEIEAGGSFLMKVPGINQQQIKVFSQEEDGVLILKSDSISNDFSVSINGDTIDLVVGYLEDEAELYSFLKDLRAKLGNFQVIGGDVELYIKESALFLNELSQYFFEKINFDAQKEDDWRDIRSRMRMVQKKNKSIVFTLLEMLNDSSLANLNMQQKADYLRSLDADRKSSRRLASRVRNAGTMDEIPIKVEESLNMLSIALKNTNTDLESELEVSFYSLISSLYAIQVLTEERNRLSILDPTLILQCAGIVGIALNLKALDYPDPWSVRIKRLYPGSYICESDVWMAYSQGASQSNFEAPGIRRSNINGVVALSIPYDTSVSDLMKCYLHTILHDLHVSVNMRRLLSPVRGDHQAFLSGSIWQLSKQLMDDYDGRPHRVALKDFLHLLYTLKTTTSEQFCDRFTEHMNQNLEDNLIRCFVTDPGNIEVGNMMYGIFYLILHIETIENVGRYIQALFNFHVYQTLNSNYQGIGAVEKRYQDLLNILGIDLEKTRTKVNAIFEEENIDIVHHSHWDEDKLREYIPSKFAHLYQCAKRMSFLVHLLSSISSYKIENGFSREQEEEIINTMYDSTLEFHQMEDHCFRFGVEGDITDFINATVVQCYVTKKQKNRVHILNGSTTALIPELGTTESQINYLYQVTTKIHSRDYLKRLKEKNKIEHQVRLDGCLQICLECDNISEFIDEVSYIANRSSDGFITLESRLLEQTVQDFMYLTGLSDTEAELIYFKKLWILYTGKNWEDETVWANGNFYAGTKRFSYIDKFKQSNSKLVRDQYFSLSTNNTGVWYYRSSDKPNSHGHCNSNPSHWALNYASYF